MKFENGALTVVMADPEQPAGAPTTCGTFSAFSRSRRCWPSPKQIEDAINKAYSGK